MPSYPLKQPNGLFAVFTTVADGFTDVNLTSDEVIEYGSLEWGREGAIIKLEGAVQDKFIWKPYPLNDGLGRWRECLKLIAIRNGLDHLAKVLADMGLPEADIPPDVIEAATVQA
jgi:hypothetical protein